MLTGSNYVTIFYFLVDRVPYQLFHSFTRNQGQVNSSTVTLVILFMPLKYRHSIRFFQASYTSPVCQTFLSMSSSTRFLLKALNQVIWSCQLKTNLIDALYHPLRRMSE